MHIILLIAGVYIDRATGFQNDASMTGVHRICSDIVFHALTQKYGPKWSATELETLCRDDCVFKHKVTNRFLFIFKSGLFTLKFPFKTMIADISRFWSLSSLEALPY